MALVAMFALVCCDGLGVQESEAPEERDWEEVKREISGNERARLALLAVKYGVSLEQAENVVCSYADLTSIWVFEDHSFLAFCFSSEEQWEEAWENSDTEVVVYGANADSIGVYCSEIARIINVSKEDVAAIILDFD